VVATDVGGTAEIFPAEKDGALLVDLDNLQQLADVINRLLGDEELQQQLGRGGRLRAELCFSIPRAAEALASHYRQLLPG
jgi:glycosyltransferase involved in cell wall biosynthesis